LRRAGDARHVLTFATILFVALFAVGVVEGFLRAGTGVTTLGAWSAWMGYFAQLIVSTLVFLCMTLRRPADAFRSAVLALLVEQAMGLCVALVLVWVWPWFGAPDVVLAALGLAVTFAGMMLGVAWGIHVTGRNSDLP
jgi:hypothetical protein